MVGFGFLLAWVMAGGSLAYTALSVLSVFVIGDLAITRSQFGLLVGALSLVGMISAPAVGLFADRQGGTFALRLLLVVTALGLLATAVAPVFWVMVVALIIAGVGSTSGNPITNNLIASYIPDGSRGPMVGIKHAGGQLGVLTASLLLPTLAISFGWRTSVALLALVPLLGLAMSSLSRPSQHMVIDSLDHVTRRRPRSPLVVNAVLMGFGSSALIAFLPLYSQEALGMSVGSASAALAVVAGFAVVSRLLWGWRGDMFGGVTTPLMWIALISIAATAALALAGSVGPAGVWVGAGLAGMGTMAWHSAGMLVVLAGAGSHNSGVATAAVHVGFLGGWTVGPLGFGFIADQASYLVGWLFLTMVFAAAAMVVTERRTGAQRVKED